MVHMKSRVLLFAYVFSFARCKVPKADACTYIAYLKKLFNISGVECETNSICNKTFNVTYIDFPPYVYKNMKEDENDQNTILQRPIHKLLGRCCGNCTKINEVFLNNISEVTSSVIKTSDFVYPISASSLRKHLYGHYYVSLIDIPDLMYVSVAEGVNVSEMLSHVLPVAIVCMMLSLIAGFICWLLKTWSNEEEFSRSSLIGWYEGIWWSFVSMTTVGYGDKAPKSVVGRIFTVVWILIGVTACALIVGLVIAEVAKVNSPPLPQLKGKKIPALLYRDFDHLMAVKNGGILMHQNKESETKDFTDDVLQPISKLQRGIISGFVVDEYTLGYLIFHMEFVWKWTSNSSIIRLADYYRDNVIGLKVGANAPHQFTYGALVKHNQDYIYFKEAMQDLRITNQVEYASLLQRIYSDKVKKFYMEKNDLFSFSGYYFVRTSKVVAGLVGFIGLFGMLYELKRHMK